MVTDSEKMVIIMMAIEVGVPIEDLGAATEEVRAVKITKASNR